MKPQDLVFFIIFIALLIIRKPKVFLVAGIGSWIISIPLFAKWVFFTAERLTWYGAAFIAAACIFDLIYGDKRSPSHT